MELVIVFLAFIIAVLLSRIILYKKDLRTLVKEIKFIDEKELSNRKIAGSGSVKEIEDVKEAVNTLILEKQKMRKQYRDTEAKNKEIIASISHDLRTPLTSIKGYIDLLDKRNSDEKSKKYIEIIKARTDSLGILISTFYDLTKLEAMGRDMKLEYVDLKESLTSVLALYYERFGDKDIVPKIDIGIEDFSVLGDKHSIERVFANLIDNSIKYSKSSVEIVLGLEYGKIVTKIINDSDDLNEENIEKLFNKFYVIDTARQSESTGLGLFITREIINDMGYSIDADLVDGKLQIKIIWK